MIISNGIADNILGLGQGQDAHMNAVRSAGQLMRNRQIAAQQANRTRTGWSRGVAPVQLLPTQNVRTLSRNAQAVTNSAKPNVVYRANSNPQLTSHQLRSQIMQNRVPISRSTWSHRTSYVPSGQTVVNVSTAQSMDQATVRKIAEDASKKAAEAAIQVAQKAADDLKAQAALTIRKKSKLPYILGGIGILLTVAGIYYVGQK
jgi:urocanate hydratase